VLRRRRCAVRCAVQRRRRPSLATPCPPRRLGMD
jgi:hypothetical protein